MVLVSLRDRGVQMVANMKKNEIACRVAAVILLLVITVSSNVDFNIYWQRILSSDLVRDPSNFLDHSKAYKARELLDKLRETSLLAADGHDYTFTAAERREWRSQNPCQSRSELAPMYAARKHIRNISPNPVWDQVLAEYANLHRICRKRVGNLTDHILNNPSATIPGCKFLIAEGVFGFGNRVLVAVSAMLYAVVSIRIILVPSQMSYRAVFCEPFEGSSWFLDEDTFPMPGVNKLNNPWIEGPNFTERLNQTLNLLEEQKRGHQSERKAGTLPPLGNAVVLSARWGPWSPEKWFFCNTEQQYLSQVPWLFYSGCIYSIPDMYGSAPFGATLQALFPDRMVITRLLRTSFFPSDSVWSKFKHFNRLNFEHADRRVSIQLRFFDKESRKTMSDEMTRRVMDCALTNGILPKLNESTTEASMSPPPSTPITNVFVASLHSELHDYLRDFYLPTISPRDAVELVQISSRHEQQMEGDLTEEDTQAFVEILILSFSDSLVVTPASTFGQVSQAYGGLIPWILKVTWEDGPSCERGQTVDPCQQWGHPGYACVYDPHSPPDWSGLLGLCLKIDRGNKMPSGVQILDNHLNWQEARRGSNL